MANGPLPVHVVNNQEETNVPVVPVEIKRIKKPPVIEIALFVSEEEFLGREGVDDQILWRLRDKEYEGELFFRKLQAQTTPLFQQGNFSDLPKSWDGAVYLISEEAQFVISANEDHLCALAELCEDVVNLIGALKHKTKFEQQRKRLLEKYGDDEGPPQRKQLREWISANEAEKVFPVSLQKALPESFAELRRIPPLRAGRGAVCSSFEGKWTSIVIRGAVPGAPEISETDEAKTDEAKIVASDPVHATKWKDAGKWKAPEKREEPFLFSISDYVKSISDAVFHEGYEKPATGLIVIMAETSAGKSQIAYGLMHHYLQERIAQMGDKKPFWHVVTLEDPIEKRAYPAESYPNESRTVGYRVEYTARHKQFDTDLRTGLSDCLRQKPAVVCVGEIRNVDDWPHVLEFAATGHLVVATAHAGKLSEAMGKILHACKANSPSQRGDEARKILAMIQLQSDKISINGEKYNVTHSTVWRRDCGGANGLVSEGLDSIVPHDSPDKGTLGAQAMCRLLTKEIKNEVARQKGLTADELVTQLLHSARGFDTKGI
jgi:hypothetical protein